jgi:hypothetical protein
MSKQSVHGQLIATAARAALSPIGCQRVGRSRRWISDQRFWIISVEFQPSGWSKGTYLNIAAKWLWDTEPGLDLSYRPVDYIPFETTEQFSPLIRSMANRAAQEVVALRERFKSFSAVRHHLLAGATSDGWPVYHAAIAVALWGDVGASRRLFARLQEWPTNGYDWEKELQAKGAALAALLGSPGRFRDKIRSLIQECRKRYDLSPDPNCLELIDSTAAQ